MKVRQHGNALVFEQLIRPVLEAYKLLPGRKKFMNGAAWVEASGANIEVLLRLLPSLAEARLEAVEKFLGVRETETANLMAKALPAEASCFPFKTQPFEHQLKAFGMSRHSEYFGLFMEMGTGKTKILIDNTFALYGDGYVETAIVITLNGVHQQWVDQQIPEHAPDFPWEAHAYHSGLSTKALRELDEAVDRRGKLMWFTMAFEALSSKRAQEMLMRWVRRGKVMLILDESQKIKNPDAARTKLLLKLAPLVQFRRIATGTEVTQGLEDLYSQMKFLHPHILGHNSFFSFRNEYCRLAPIPGAPSGAYRIVGYNNVEKLKHRVSGCTFQVLKKDCLDLPDKIYQQRFVPMTDEQLKHYNTLKKYMIAELSSGNIIEAPLAITMLMKLQQVVSGHLIDEEGVVHRIPNNRVSAVLDVLEERKTAIVWARFRADIEILAEELKAQGYRVGTYFGDTSQDERTRIIQPGAVDVLIANQQSAGAGLNLTHFNTAVYYSNSFNAADRWQSEDRIHRIGQSEKCLYVDLVSPNTVDMKLIEALKKKREIADVVRSAPEVDLLMQELGISEPAHTEGM